MKRFSSRLFRFFWSWGFLKFALFALTGILLLVVEEDWRGARAWAATKARWEARGASFDLNTYLPPAVPDDQNLMTLPLFKLEPDPDPDPRWHGVMVPLLLQQAFTHDNAGWPESHGDWQNGKLIDMEKFKATVKDEYGKVFPGHELPASVATQFAELYPVVAELREASATRPVCRFNLDYKLEADQSRLNLITQQIQVSKYATWDALLALDAHDPARALADIKLNNKIASGLARQPMLVCGLVAIGMTAIDFSAVYQGLATGAWNDAQLAGLEADLGQLDFIRGYRGMLRGEALGFLVPELDRVKQRGLVLWHSKSGEEQRDDFVTLWPNGWIDLWKERSTDIDFMASSWVDPEARRFLPEAVTADHAAFQKRLDSWTIFLPWNWLLRIGTNDSVFKQPSKFGQLQVWVDQARITCALERCRLAHGAYPGTLDALAPQFIEAVPNDVMNGEPYHYRLNGDGTFLLYSVGWNQQDDGGVEVRSDKNPMRDYTKGDWVWPVVKR